MVKKSRVMERHHRLPRSRGGTDTFPPGNVVNMEQDIHRAWHKIVGNMNAEEVAAMLTDHFIDPRYYLIALPRGRRKPKRRRQRLFCTDCDAEVLKSISRTCKGDK
jgi:hypothetical protein